MSDLCGENFARDDLEKLAIAFRYYGTRNDIDK